MFTDAKSKQNCFMYFENRIENAFSLVIVLTGLFGGNKDTIKKFYIDFNNLLVDTMDKKYSPDEIMILLPIVCSIRMRIQNNK